tara:strand:- start:7427 stop:8653 length:1227 start_codon:yes stop_codon:yes gene_type:complete
MQHKILLLDELGEKWGNTHVYHNLRTPAEAIKLLCINYPDFQQHLLDSEKNGISYKITQVNQDLDVSELVLPLGQHDLVIAPVITGSRGAVKALLGVAMIAVAFALPVTAPLAPLSFTGTGFVGGTAFAGILANVGAALVLTGVSEMIAPQPQLPGFDAPMSGFMGGAGGITRGSDGSQSYGYIGAANTVGLGKTIPVVYGKALVGGHILSTDIEVATSENTLMEYIRPPSLDTVRLNGEELKEKYTNAGGLQARIYNGTLSNAQGTKSYLNSTVTIDLSKRGRQKIVDIQGESSGDKKTKQFQIFFEVRGLVDFVGEAGTTRIDGFITYRVIVQEDSKNQLVLNNQATIQGLTQKSQFYKYIAKLPYQKVPDKDNYEVFIQIIDAGVDLDKASFKIKEVGYRLKMGD